jgi:hypothetical protein
MKNLYLRYKDSDLEKLNKLTDIIIEDLISRQVLQHHVIFLAQIHITK